MKIFFIGLVLSLSASFAFAADDQNTRQKACDSATTKQYCYQCCLEKAKNVMVTTEKIAACDRSTTKAESFLMCLDYSKSRNVTPDRILQCNKVGTSANSFYNCLRYFY